MTLIMLCISVGATQYFATEAPVKTAPECKYTVSANTSSQMIVIGRLIDRTESSKVAILIDEGQIRQIGSAKEIHSMAPRAQKIECDGVYISPGFVNAHEHPPYSGGKPGPNVAPVYENRYQWQGRAGDQYPEIAYSRIENDAQLYS